MAGLERIIGVDIAKIIAMFFVVAIHISGYGLKELDAGMSYGGVEFVRIVCRTIFMSCIDIFAIASGFVGIVAAPSLQKILRLWGRVAITGALGVLIASIVTSGAVNIKDFLRAFFPVVTGQYWYMTSYFMLMLVMPIVNLGLMAIEQVAFKRLLFVVIFITSVCSIAYSDCILGLCAGYSFEWLLVLYMLGAYIRRFGMMPLPASTMIAIAFLCVGASSSLQIVASVIDGGIAQVLSKHVKFTGYTNPFTLTIAICIFAACLKTKIESTVLKRAIQRVSYSTLGVYLLTEQRVVRKLLLVPLSNVPVIESGGSWLFWLIVMAIGAFTVACIIDQIRFYVGKFIFNLLPWRRAGL